MVRTEAILGCVLAGGRSTRMGGGEKPLLRLAGVRLIDRVLARLSSQVGALAVSSNGDPARWALGAVPLLPDGRDDRPGPLAGVLAALDHAREIGAERVATVAGDTPFFPGDLVESLADAALRPDVIAVAATGDGWQPTFALWPLSARDDVAAALEAGENRVRRLIERRPHRVVRVPPIRVGDVVVDPFFNVNTPADFGAAEAIAAVLDGAEEGA